MTAAGMERIDALGRGSSALLVMLLPLLSAASCSRSPSLDRVASATRAESPDPEMEAPLGNSIAPPPLGNMDAEAREALDQLQEDYPESVESLYARGQIAMLYGHTDYAIWCWNRCLAVDADHVPARVELGAAFLKGGDLEQAAARLREAHELQPDLPEARLNLGKVLNKLGRFEETLIVLDRQSSSRSWSAEEWFYLGQACFEIEDYERARVCYEAALDIYPECRPAVHGMAQVCRQLGQAPAADAWSKRVLELDEQAAEADRAARKGKQSKGNNQQVLALALDLAATARHWHGDAARAEAYWRRAAELDSKNVECRRRLASLLTGQHRSADAILIVEELRQLEPRNVEFLLALGMLHEQRNDWDAVEQSFQEVLKIEPDHSGAQASLIRLYLASGRELPQARQLAERLVRLQPTGEHFYLLSTACLANQDPGGGRAALREARRLDPQNPIYAQAANRFSKE